MSALDTYDPLPQPKEVVELGWSNTSEEKIKEAYSVWSDYDDHVAPSGYVGHIFCAEIFDKFASEFHAEESKRNLKILDMGCGTGLASHILKERFGYNNLAALDVSEHMLEKAREKRIFNRFICSYVTNKRVNAIQSAEFEGLVSSAAVTPGQIRPEAFDEILRWMKPGAIICFTCRHDAYVSVEYGYQAKFNELEKDKKWTLISNMETDYYRHPRADEFSHSKTRVLVYRVLPF